MGGILDELSFDVLLIDLAAVICVVKISDTQ
jgi:hypothetical protein